MSNNGNTTLEIRNEPTLLEISGFLAPPAGGGGELVPVDPHKALIGPSTGSAQALPTYRLLVTADTPYAPALALPNTFNNVNKIPGLRINTVVRTTDFSVGTTDFENYCDATGGQIDGVLPAATGTGQIYRFKKGDQTTNLITITAAAGDLIDGDTYVPLRFYKDDLVIIDAALHVWDRFTGGGGGAVDDTDLAHLSTPNEFLAQNIFHGIAFSPRLIATDNQVLTSLDTEVLIDATLADYDVFLSASVGLGQWHHIKKIDPTIHVVNIIANGTDLIDGTVSVSLEQQWADCTLMDAQVGYWDNVGAGPMLSVPTIFQIGRWARFVEANSPNGISLQLFNGTSWVTKWTETI
jgi:hypothetical protein